MKSSLFMLALAVSISLAAAGGVAAWLPVPQSSADFTLIGGQAGSASFAGHAGAYGVTAWRTNATIYVGLVGSNASARELAVELNYLQSSGALEPACPASGIADMGQASAFVCQNDGKWLAFPQPEAPVPAEGAQEKAVSNDAYAPLAKSVPGRAQTAGTGAGPADAGARQASAPQEGSVVGAEQALQLFAAFIAVLVASYLVLTSQPAPVDAAAERLLDNPTRAGIMEELSTADKIPTDISARLGKSKASVVEHLAALAEAGLVERVARPGRKFVYYRLTQKGRRLLLKKAG